jgi:hypothetical protein
MLNFIHEEELPLINILGGERWSAPALAEHRINEVIFDTRVCY